MTEKKCKCGSRIVVYEGEELCMTCPAPKKREQAKELSAQNAGKPMRVILVEPDVVLPRFEYYYGTDRVKFTFWVDDDGRLHRDGDRPALRHYYQDGGLLRETYYKHGIVSRDASKPAVIARVKNGKVSHEEYWLAGIKIKEQNYVV